MCRKQCPLRCVLGTKIAGKGSGRDGPIDMPPNQATALLHALPGMSEQNLLRLMVRQGPDPAPWLDLCRFNCERQVP